MTIPAALVREEAHALGFMALAATTAEPLCREGEALEAWLEAGQGDGLAYMARRPRDRASPRAFLPEARTVLCLGIPYAWDGPPFAAQGRFGRVARYAWGRDYHDVVPPRLDALALALGRRLGRSLRTRSATDSQPLLERALAARAGLGFVGKHTNLILPRAGSWWLLAELLLDEEVEPFGAPPAVSCGTCARCLTHCPTGAFVAAHRLDARRCISFLTIDNRGPIPLELRAGIGAWVFGCDVCQEVCPFQRFSAPPTWPEFLPEAGTGPRLDLLEVLATRRAEDFRARFRGTPLSYAKRSGLLRNAAVVARNVGASAAVPLLETCVREDAEGLVRGHALWALAGLDPARARALAEGTRGSDPDAFVLAEAEHVLAGDGGAHPP